MPRFSSNKNKSSSDSKRHFTLLKGDKEYGLFYGSTPSAAALMVATKLCSSNKGKKTEFYIREITQESKKKTYGPYVGEVKKLKSSELNGDGKSYKIVSKKKKLGMKGGAGIDDIVISYGDCGKLHRFSFKTAFKKCIILIYENRKITIGSNDRNTIQVKYFNDVSNSTYYKKDKFSIQKTNILLFTDIINELIKLQSSQDKLIQLIDKILRHITSIRSNGDDIELIIQWLKNSKNDGSAVNVQKNSRKSLPPPPPPPPPTYSPYRQINPSSLPSENTTSRMRAEEATNNQNISGLNASNRFQRARAIVGHSLAERYKTNQPSLPTRPHPLHRQINPNSLPSKNTTSRMRAAEATNNQNISGLSASNRHQLARAMLARSLAERYRTNRPHQPTHNPTQFATQPQNHPLSGGGDY
jgi:hypothetical protein